MVAIAVTAGNLLFCSLLGYALAKLDFPGRKALFLVVMGMLMGLIYSFLTVSLRANQNVTGLAMTTFGVGLMKVIMSEMDETVYLVGPKLLYRWPFAGRTDALQYLGVMFFLGVIIAIAASYVLYRTRVGLHLRAVGESPATADAMGVNVSKYKYGASCVGCGIAGLGGFYYIIDYMASTEAYKSLEGLGWLSVALVIFALWRPHMTIIGSTIFGFLFSCHSDFQPSNHRCQYSSLRRRRPCHLPASVRGSRRSARNHRCRRAPYW